MYPFLNITLFFYVEYVSQGIRTSLWKCFQREMKSCEILRYKPGIISTITTIIVTCIGGVQVGCVSSTEIIPLYTRH